MTLVLAHSEVDWVPSSSSKAVTAKLPESKASKMYERAGRFGRRMHYYADWRSVNIECAVPFLKFEHGVKGIRVKARYRLAWPYTYIPPTGALSSLSIVSVI